MTHPWDRHYNIAFWLLLLAGIGLCIGGIFIPPLLIPGGVCLAGSFGMYSSAYTRMYPWHLDQNPTAATQAMSSEQEQVPGYVKPEDHPHFTMLIDDHSVTFAPHFEMARHDHGLSQHTDEPEIHRSQSEPVQLHNAHETQRLTLS